MSRAPVPFPSREDGLGLHIRLIEADPTATADVCRAYLVPLGAWLAARSPTVDPHLVETAVHIALMDYLQHPERFDPCRADLAVYLRMAAPRDLANLIRDEGRHHRKRVIWDSVEMDEDGGNLSGREEAPPLQMERAEEEAAWQDRLRRFRDGLAERDRPVFDLLLAGERATATFAAALHLDGMPPEEQEREVKRAKDRVKVKLKREGLGHG